MSKLLTLLSPLDYLRIRHPLKRFVDVWATVLPFFMGVTLTAVFPDFNIFGSSGLISGLNSVLSILPGFYITSLAAIATFSGAAYRIDDRLEGEQALLAGDALTRRQFLCHLFAYLSLLSLLLYFSGVVGMAAATSPHSAVIASHRLLIHYGFVSFYVALLGNIIGATLIGLIFLSNRMTRVPKSERTIVMPRASALEKNGETKS